MEYNLPAHPLTVLFPAPLGGEGMAPEFPFLKGMRFIQFLNGTSEKGEKKFHPVLFFLLLKFGEISGKMRSSKICFTFFFLTLLGVNVAQGQPGASKDSSFSTIKANALKFAPMELMNGDFPIYYEHRFSNHFAAQVGVGLTFKDLFWELSRTFNDLDQGHETEANAGFSVKGELRYYISDQRIALNGTYFAARGSYRYYNALCAVCLDRLTLDTGPFLNETRNTTDGLVILGYQYYTKSNFIIDGYIGGGVRLMSGHIARCVQVSGSEPMPVLRVEQDFEPRFAIGLRFGFGL